VLANKDNLMPDAFLDIHPDGSIATQQVKATSAPKTEAKAGAEKSDVDVEKIFTAIDSSLGEDLVRKVKDFLYHSVKNLVTTDYEKFVFFRGGNMTLCANAIILSYHLMCNPLIYYCNVHN
jgi:hypothetical protein